MAVISAPVLSALRTAYSDVFQKAYTRAPSHWDKVATRVNSTSASNTYGWLGQFPRLREWVGARAFRDMKEFGYTIPNRKFEASVEISRVDFEDDNLGVYNPLFQEMGYAAAVHPDEIVFGLLRDGETNPCADGKPFFSADHPVYPNVDGTGTAKDASNLISGSNDPWYLLDIFRPLKPFIFQERTRPELEAITTTSNEKVFNYDTYPFGIRYRCAGGYGFWQQAICSKEELSEAAFEKALTAMQGFAADGGRPLGLGFGGQSGLLLVVPPSMNAQARKVLMAERNDAGASNIWFQAASLLVSPWLSLPAQAAEETEEKSD